LVFTRHLAVVDEEAAHVAREHGVPFRVPQQMAVPHQVYLLARAEERAVKVFEGALQRNEELVSSELPWPNAQIFCVDAEDWMRPT